ncbi:MAG TPA: carbon monoxide dehydrogenase subunit G, partial [Kofleriaceae bacterium]|nr:carbon monoxide dehydrogenase subunit G [Kofleriaceae bacterium]
MKLEGDYLFEASVPEVWSALFDPVILAAVMPGCEKLELVDGHYVGDIKVKVGPIQGKFTGRVDLTDKIEPQSYTMVVDGRGAPGFVKATAHVVLAPEGDATRVRYDTDAQIGGKIASVGQRLIEASARAIVAQSLEGLHTNIKLRAAAHREAAAKHAAATAVSGAPEVMTEVVPSPEMASAGNEVTGVTDVMPSPPIASAQHEASGVTEPTTAPPAAAPAASVPPAGGLSAASVGSEGAWSAEATVKTDSPTYIDEAAFDAARRARQAAADAAKSAAPAAAAPTATAPAAPAVAFTPVKVKQSALA